MTRRARGEPPAPDDRRSRFSMAQFVRERLALDDRGWTRAELETLLRRQPRFWPQVQRNPKALRELIRRLIGRREVEERNGKLFAAESMQISICARRQLFELVRDG